MIRSLWWRDGAACTLPGSTLWDEPAYREPGVDRRIEQAKKICRACPALRDCLEDVIASNAMGVKVSGVQAGELWIDGKIAPKKPKRAVA